MKRYSPDISYGPSDVAIMEEDKEGDYVKMSDVLSMLDAIHTDMIDEGIAVADMIEKLRS
jgi:hypothetical protein